MHGTVQTRLPTQEWMNQSRRDEEHARRVNVWMSFFGMMEMDCQQEVIEKAIRRGGGPASRFLPLVTLATSPFPGTSERTREQESASMGGDEVPPEQAQEAADAVPPVVALTTVSSSPEKQKGNRRLSRLFRGPSSFPKKTRTDHRRRRSTGMAPTTEGTPRSLPREAAANSQPAAHNHPRKRSLFRRRPRSPPPTEASTTISKAAGYPQTHVIARAQSPPRRRQAPEAREEKKEEEPRYEEAAAESRHYFGRSATAALCTSTEIFQHSYLETLCGVHHRPDDASIHDEEAAAPSNSRRSAIPDDPTVQESIECVFSTCLEEDIARMLQLADDEDDAEEDAAMEESSLPAPPSMIQQSVMRTRSDLSATTRPMSSPQLRASRKRVESLKLAHVGSFRREAASALDSPLASFPGVTAEPLAAATTTPCACQSKNGPPQLDPSHWPQAPLLIRPTPGRGMRIQRIRLVGANSSSSSSEKAPVVLWDAQGQTTSPLSWPQALRQYWGEHATPALPDCHMCPECMVIPVNNGNEERGETLVTDFESDLFEGTLMLRLRYSNGTTQTPYRDDRGYFTGMNRRYQTVIRGRFKEAIPWTQCRTGFILDRPCGKLPAKWIMKGAVKVLSFFAPHLRVDLDCAKPMSITPLGSTPQVLRVQDPDEAYDLEEMQEEPAKKEQTLMGMATQAPSSLQRARARKKAFDKLYAHSSTDLKTDPSKVYTFEFLQHLFNFKEFSVELGSMLGSVPLAPMLDGQALPIMATHSDSDRRLWSFDVWHESLVVTGKK